VAVTLAGEGEGGLVPGSMGTRSYHVLGRGCPEALASSAHGAGRRLSRTDARRRPGAARRRSRAPDVGARGSRASDAAHEVRAGPLGSVSTAERERSSSGETGPQIEGTIGRLPRGWQPGWEYDLR
jgi:hypothetical protein